MCSAEKKYTVCFIIGFFAESAWGASRTVLLSHPVVQKSCCAKAAACSNLAAAAAAAKRCKKLRSQLCTMCRWWEGTKTAYRRQWDTEPTLLSWIFTGCLQNCKNGWTFFYHPVFRVGLSLLKQQELDKICILNTCMLSLCFYYTFFRLAQNIIHKRCYYQKFTYILFSHSRVA